MEKERLQKIYRKTDGCCHICHRKVVFSNYAKSGINGNWEVEHSKSKANGGTDHLNNLFAACIKCNREKGTKHTKTARLKYTKTRAPFSKKKKRAIQNDNTIGGAIIGGTLGLLTGNPLITITSAVVGASIGKSKSPKK